MKKIFVTLVLIIISFYSFSQLFYKNELKAVDGIEIKYKFANSSFFDKSSPLNLRFKLKNTNDFPVKIQMELVYYLNIVDMYKSGVIELCIPAKTARTGKMHGLNFEVKTDTKEDFDSDANSWEIETFIVEQTEDCKLFSKKED